MRMFVKTQFAKVEITDDEGTTLLDVTVENYELTVNVEALVTSLVNVAERVLSIQEQGND